MIRRILSLLIFRIRSPTIKRPSFIMAPPRDIVFIAQPLTALSTASTVIPNCSLALRTLIHFSRECGRASTDDPDSVRDSNGDVSGDIPGDTVRGVDAAEDETPLRSLEGIWWSGED